jgi:hypothetical protein
MLLVGQAFQCRKPLGGVGVPEQDDRGRCARITEDAAGRQAGRGRVRVATVVVDHRKVVAGGRQ